MPSLAVVHRPKSFSEMVGQKPARLVLKQMLKQGRCPQVALLEGIRGSGKTTAARLLSAALYCPQAVSGEACGTCSSCSLALKGMHPNIEELDSTLVRLEDIERILSSWDSDKKVVLFDEVDGLSKDCFGALLKTLEEPKDNQYIFMTTTEGNLIPETVKSRCLSFLFTKLTISDIIKRVEVVLEREQIKLNSVIKNLIADRADGSLRDALMYVEQARVLGIETEDHFRLVFSDRDFAPGIVVSLLEGEVPTAIGSTKEALDFYGTPAKVVNLLTKFFNDLTILHADGILNINGQSLVARKALSSRIDASQCLGSLKILWDYISKVRVEYESVQTLNMLIFLISDFLCPAKPVKVDPDLVPMSFQELKQLISSY